MAQRRKNINPKGWEELSKQFGFSQGVQVGDILYISGQVGMEASGKTLQGTEAQARQAFRNLKGVIEAAGGTTDDLVEVISFHTSMAEHDLEIVARVKAEEIPNNPFAWTAVGVTQLAFPGLLLEIRGMAVLTPG